MHWGLFITIINDLLRLSSWFHIASFLGPKPKIRILQTPKIRILWKPNITKYQKNYFSKKKVFQVGKLSLRRLGKRRHTVEPRRTSIGKPMPHLPPHDFTAVKSRCASSDMLRCVTAPSLRQLSQCPAS
jgi:hypothetical protein